MTLILSVLFLVVLKVSNALPQQVMSVEPSPLKPTCDSIVYCQGKLLNDVQMSGIFQNDSKDFVDMKLKYDEHQIMKKYENLCRKGPPSREELQKFIDENFEHGNELQEWTPPDFHHNPSLVDRVSDPLFKRWIRKINFISKTLSRKVKPDVRDNGHLYSLLYVPNGFVIPGGRFRELYYWDTYWILKGLFLCDMVDTARGIIENFIYLFKKFNIIPNGSRKYYLNRSQPPLLVPMVQMYYENTGDQAFIHNNIHVLDLEFQFWMERMVWVRNHKLARYYCPSSGPRPESYKSDIETAQNLSTESAKDKLYTKIKSAAESGHDFSSRWFIKDGTNSGNLSDIDTPDIIPVDLNAILEKNARLLSNMHNILNNTILSQHYEHRAKKLSEAIQAVLWNEEQGMWLDYDLMNHIPRNYFYLSNFAPLWTGSYQQRKKDLSKRVLDYLAKYQADIYIGGVPTSQYRTGQQWDFPNAWPPLQAILIEGLENLETPEAKIAARDYAEKWLRSNFKGYIIYGEMFEKYDAEIMGQTGNGGEYEFQKGFGWTNGVVLQLLDTYGRNVTVNDNNGDFNTLVLM